MTMQNGVGALVVGGVGALHSQPQSRPQSGSSSSSRAMTHGLGAVRVGGSIGMGMPGPDFGKDSDLSAGTYEITGTEVALFSDNATPPARGTTINPSTPGVIAFFNTAYGDNGGKIAGTPDQIEVATTEMRNGRRYALVKVKSATNAGQTDPSHPDAKNVSPGQAGLVATDYIAPVGWTASHGGTGPIPQGGDTTTTTTTTTDTTTTTTEKKSYVPWIIGGVVLAGLVVGGALVGKKGYRRVRAHSRLRRIKSRSRRRAYA